ncbi:Protein FAM83G [Tupaia chinensis]|uniref:Protein FAM83G n=1 Tax=Tupaia chinensis TaxID=246437 RepID=L9KI61_TUPCH|nr:Protein FAM83G [Tupaia chinensis]
MAFSQVQCLDDSHVNWRSSESKPEFFYSEEQRLALEALVARGPEAFYEVLKRENIRDFLSELELQRILETIEVYDPGSEDPLGTGRGRGPEDDGTGNGDGEEASGAGGTATEAELPSLEYWPQKSDRSIPQLDLGWPDTIAYRGVTRASVYMQPPIDGQAHIKEVVRKMISQAQKGQPQLWAAVLSDHIWETAFATVAATARSRAVVPGWYLSAALPGALEPVWSCVPGSEAMPDLGLCTRPMACVA